MPRAIIFTLVIVSGTVLGEGKKPFKQEEKVLSVLKSYIGCVDEKNVEGMLEHIIIPLDLHFGSQQVTTIKSKGEFEKVFNRWNNSSALYLFSSISILLEGSEFSNASLSSRTHFPPRKPLDCISILIMDSSSNL